MRYPCQTASPDRYAILKEFARHNRQYATEAERLLWDHLRGMDKSLRLKRQHVIGDYIVDFVSLEKSLVIEVDGGYHSERSQQEDDKLRTSDLESMGFAVIRFSK